MHRELDIIHSDLHANAVRLAGRDPGRLLEAAEYAASIGLRAFLADVAASVRRVYSGPIGYCSFPIERVDWDRFDVVGVNYHRQSRQGLDAEQYLAKIRAFQATGKPVMITEFGFAACRDADNPDLLAKFNATSLSLPAMHLPVARRLARPRVRTVHPRDEQAQARLLVEQLQLLDRADVDGAFIMSFSFPLPPTTLIPATTLTPPHSASSERCRPANTAARTPTWPGSRNRHSAPSPATTQPTEAYARRASNLSLIEAGMSPASKSAWRGFPSAWSSRKADSSLPCPRRRHSRSLVGIRSLPLH